MNGQVVASPAQCRAARALLRWSQQKLAEEAQIARNTVAQFEVGRRMLHRRIRAHLTSVLQSAGVEFIPDHPQEHGEGVKLRGDSGTRGAA
jgi:transcriptional regulator with XRE-family HTH domain